MNPNTAIEPNSAVTYSCAGEYELQGPKSRTCSLVDGKFKEEEEPKCKLIIARYNNPMIPYLDLLAVN